MVPLIALLALGATMALLVFDLKRPDRFFYLLTKPNFRSWLVLGAYVLMGYGACVVAWLLIVLSGERVPGVLQAVTFMTGAAAAGYSAFLFAQAKGRELWQSTLFLFHLLVQASVAGNAVFILAVRFIPQTKPKIWFAADNAIALLYLGLIFSLLMIMAEVFLPHRNKDVSLSVKTLLAGRYSRAFWGLAIGLGLVLPIALISVNLFGARLPNLGPVVAVLALAGLWWWESLWVKAGQVVPLS